MSEMSTSTNVEAGKYGLRLGRRLIRRGRDERPGGGR